MVHEMIHPEFESIVAQIVQTVDRERLAELRKDFHTRLRITLTQPESNELVDDLWNFFYDWCVFELTLPDVMAEMPENVRTSWSQLKSGNRRGLYSVRKVAKDVIKLKDLYNSDVILVPLKGPSEFLGMSQGDIIEGRLIADDTGDKKTMKFNFVRRPSYLPIEVHDYIKAKVREFKHASDFDTYQTWLWLLVGMYLKHRIYQHMPIDKIYDDNSRI